MDLPSFVEAYLTRRDWGASPLTPTAGYPIATGQVVGAVEHHTVMVLPDYDGDGYSRGDLDDILRYMRQLQRARPDLGNEVPYTFVLFPGTTDATCVVAEGRGLGRTGAHTAGLNSTRIAIAVAGNTDADAPLTDGMVRGFRWVCSWALDDPAGAVATIGHQQAPPYFQNGVNLNATACPGRDGMANLPKLQPPFTIDDPAPAEEDDDMLAEDRQQLYAIAGVVSDLAAHIKGSDGGRMDRIEKGVVVDIPTVVAASGQAVKGHLEHVVLNIAVPRLETDDEDGGGPVDVQALATALLPHLREGQADELADAILRRQAEITAAGLAAAGGQ
jgi:hypothetical protein